MFAFFFSFFLIWKLEINSVYRNFTVKTKKTIFLAINQTFCIKKIIKELKTYELPNINEIIHEFNKSCSFDFNEECVRKDKLYLK